MKKIFVKELEKGLFEDIFALRKIRKKEKREGGYFYELYISDKTGEMRAYIFENIENFEKILKEGIFKIKGEVFERDGEIVCKLYEANEIEEIDLREILPSSPRDINEMENMLEAIIITIENEYLRKLLDTVFNDPFIRKEFLRAPAAKKIHHAYIGGLIEHTLNVVRILEVLIEVYPEIKRDILITGALLHDIGKIKTYEYRTGIDLSDEGRLLDHIYLGIKIVDEKINKINNFPENLKLRILHMIASHHGEKSMGAIAEPMTEEALLLHFADYMDTQMFKFKKAREESKEGARWSEYQKDLQRYVFLGGEEE
ncbi:MAG: HD domain-containing protein [candidate division WOR-3 bacterium]